MGFIFDGVSSSEMGIPSRMSVQNRIPDIRNNTDKLAGRHGIMDFGETISERKIEITCLIPPGLNAHQLLDKKDSIVWQEKYPVQAGIADGHIYIDKELNPGRLPYPCLY